MKWMRFLFLWFLIPLLVHARLHEKDCQNICQQATREERQCSLFITKYKGFIQFANKESVIPILNDAMECCSRAIGHYDTILNDIAQQSKKHRHEGWCKKMKKDCEKNKNELISVLNNLETELNNTLSHVAFKKAEALHKESESKADLANIKTQSCPPRRLNNIDEVVAVLIEVAHLYEEAAAKEREALAILIAAPYAKEENKVVLTQAIENFQALANKNKKEATEWAISVSTQKTILKEKVATLKEDIKLFTEKGLKRSGYELQKQAIPILEQLIENSSGEEGESFKEEIALLKGAISVFEKESDSSRLTDSTPFLSPEEFKAREKDRKALFFKSDFLLAPDLFFSENLENSFFPRVVPLDGQKGKKKGDFVLYTEQFYRFLVQSESAIPELSIQVFENGEVIHVEKISLPFENPQGWEAYLKSGMLFIPETKLKSDFGLDLRLSFACNPANKFSMLIAQKSTETRYQFSVSLTPETPLYECSFSAPPPWQLANLRKPALATPNPPTDPSSLSCKKVPFDDDDDSDLIEPHCFPVLDKLVEELKNDPLALASYVQNEIAFVDPYLHQENGVFHASGIHRNPCMTYLEQQGTPWELCQLLVYLLRKAGHPAVYATGAPFSLPKDFVERLLLTKLPEEASEGLLQYPWVVFFDGKEWISLFPWMKEIQIQEGHDLYNYMPEDYASANRWILRYLKGDEKILKHIGPDGDDTAGILFVRFVEEELRKQGLSLNDIGIHRTQIKRQFSSWKDFPHPSRPDQVQIFTTLNEDSHLFDKIKIKVCSHQNPDKALFCAIPLTRLSCGPSSIHFSSHDKKHQLHLQIAGENILPCLELDELDQWVDIKIDYKIILGRQILGFAQTFHMAKGTTAALCSHFGGESPKMTTQFYEQFSAEKDEKKRLLAFLSFVGSSYFEKCSRAEKILARLHKINPLIMFAFGLSKLSPDLSKGAFQANEASVLPQVDMSWFQAGLPTITHPSVWHQEFYTARMQCESLFTVDASSNEHQILREVFKDPYAVSTVKLLQLAHQQQQKNGVEGEGFLSFTATSFEAADKTPEAAQSLYFSHLKDLNLREVKASSSGQWNTLKKQLDPNDPLSAWSYAYMTPGLIFSQDNSYKEMGTLILSPDTQYALISSNTLIFHGGLGSPLPRSYFTPYAIKEWQLIPTLGGYNSYTLNLPLQFTPSSTYTPPAVIQSLPGTTTWRDDVRAIYKATVNYVGDPVDIVTGAFYLDETDLILPGPFSLTIRRNYNSQNPLIGDMGCGWKLSLNPRLIDQDGKRFAAELDGTVIVYSYNRQTGRWEVFSEDNPELSNFNQQGIGSFATPFHSYIENDLLYGADGSKRFYENGLLQKWEDIRGNTLSFFYQDDQLSRIESSNGDFCGFHYNHAGNIAEIYAKDGRRISYTYDSQGDLVKVLLPNTAEIRYEYDRHHRIIRETKPHGKVLENIYDDRGRVKEQRSPMGLQQEMIPTAIFEYAEGITTVTDANEKKTTYKIFEKQIYKITDPLGFSILQAWFIDEKSWFDPETEKVTEWDQKGGAIRSLKATTDKRGLTTSYLYDNRGNPEIITLEGEDLTGSGESKVSKKFVHNERNLCIEEEVQGQRTLTTYDPNLPYLPKRIEKYSGNILISYVDWEYNSLGQLEKEDHSGSLTLWKYNSRGFPSQKIQVTGTGDPDVITTYAYSHQGQCIKITSADGVQENRYDLMGNQTESKVFSLSGELLSATYMGYDLNNMLIWKQAANPQNTIYFDYHASGLIKAKRQSLTPSHLIAYTLYEYNARGDLIGEVDPLGNTVYRDYDALGRVKSETRENLSTFFTYEPGGLLEAIVSPSGAKTTRFYTTNGLIKEELYPDGTKSTILYDCLSRPIRETKNGITWEITYDDPHHRLTRTNVATKDSEIEEFDARGNLIRFTDAAGHTSEKTYDHLNRIKTETSPSGEQIVWSYQGDNLICTLPNGEKRTQRYEGSCVAESKVVDPQGHLLTTNSYRYDPETDIQKVIQGEEITTTWMNSLGLPIKVQKGSLITTYEYDFCGRCIASTDGDGRTTHLTCDGLGRIAQKELPDGGLIEYVYDLDSNLAECHLPNGTVWKASYDSMKRKTQEALQAGAQSSLQWEYTYEKGYLKETKDPMQRVHVYFYGPNGRLAQETVEGWQRNFTYDPRGLLASAEQIGTQKHSKVERSYDAEGRLILETVYLDGTLIQQTEQTWESSNRSLQIGDHTRDFIYQNNQLVHISTQEVDLSYSYDLSGLLKNKSTSFSTTTIDYNPSGLPESIHTQLPNHTYQETLEWYPSGKLATYSAPTRQKQFTYTERGHLQTAGGENYDFDFGTAGIGVRTAAPDSLVPERGLDVFGKIITEINDKEVCTTHYNPMGQVIAQGSREFEWDPWGKLLRISDVTFTWEASYDALGRRLQTRYTPIGNPTITATSFYDPEQKFQEIGVKYNDKTFWKVYGPSSCDAMTDETGASVILLHNAIDQLIGVISQQGTHHLEQSCSSYGPQVAVPSIPSDLLSYAQSLSWHSQAQDPTGLIWMGERYYDPQRGRFLSTDSVGYPACLDLYVYANGDPINYFDPDGRFASPVYQAIKPVVIEAFQPFINQTIQSFNSLPAYLANHDLTRSASFQVGSFDLSRGSIGFINGINNQRADSIASAQQLSDYAGGAKIYGIYNATNWDTNWIASIVIDVIECGLGHMGMHTPPVQLLKNQWSHFIATHGPDEKFLQVSTSGGALHVYNALLTSPESVRQRIISLALAPAAIIPKRLCFESYNYMSRRDFVSYLDIIGNLRYGNELHILEPHPDADPWDHPFLSPTFKDPIKYRINNYIKN